MFAPDVSLFLWLNITPQSPHWVLPLARFGSLILPGMLLAGTALALASRDARSRELALRALAAMAMAWLAARGIQALWPLPRPFVLGLGTAWLPHGGSAGFPSTHASVALAFGTSCALGLRHRGAALLVLVLALSGWVGWSRVALGLHFPSDVLAAALVGAASAALVTLWAARPQSGGALRFWPAYFR